MPMHAHAVIPALHPQQEACRDAIIQNPSILLLSGVGMGRSVAIHSALHETGCYPAVWLSSRFMISHESRETSQWSPGRRGIPIKDLRFFPQRLEGADLVAVNYEKIALPQGHYRDPIAGLAPRAVIAAECSRLAGMEHDRFARVVSLAAGAERRILYGYLEMTTRPLAFLRAALEFMGRLDLWQDTLGGVAPPQGFFAPFKPWEDPGTIAYERMREGNLARRLMRAMVEAGCLYPIERPEEFA